MQRMYVLLYVIYEVGRWFWYEVACVCVVIHVIEVTGLCDGSMELDASNH